MRLIYIALFGILIFGCINGPIDNNSTVSNNSIHSSTNLSNQTLQPFLSEGCTYDTKYERLIYCNENASFVTKFNCPTTMYLEPRGAYLSPVLFPLFDCNKLTYNESSDEYDINCGGLGRRCSAYLYWNGIEFVQIQNKAQLAAVVSPISDENEALGYLLLATGNMDSLAFGIFTAKAQKTTDGYLVTAFTANFFGCYDKRDYFEVRYHVFSNGSIKELSRTVVFTEPLDSMICVD